MTERDILPLTLEQMRVIVDALNVHYDLLLQALLRVEIPRSPEISKELAFIQETLQYVTLMYNIRTKKLNEDVARAGGLTLEETVDSSGESTRT